MGNAHEREQPDAEREQPDGESLVEQRADKDEEKGPWPDTSMAPSLRAGGLFVVDMAQIRHTTTRHLVDSGRSAGLAAIVFAGGREKFAVTELLSLVQDWNYRLDGYVSFFFVGHVGDEERGDSEFTSYIPQDSFSEEVFTDTIHEFQQGSSWDYRGDISVILCRAHLMYHKQSGEPRAFLDLESIIEINLERAAGEHFVDSVNSIFETVVRVAQETPGGEVAWKFNAVFRGDLLGNVFIEAVEAKLPRSMTLANALRFLGAKRTRTDP
jgi:hypothetical protein